MSGERLPAVSTLSSLTAEERAMVLSELFEPCQTLNELGVSELGRKTFNSYDELIEHVRALLLSLHASGVDSDIKTLLAVLAAHPRLGEKKVVVSEHSQKEQASLAGSEEEGAMLKQLNDEYEMRFPGMKLSSGSTINQNSIADADRFAIGCSEMRYV